MEGHDAPLYNFVIPIIHTRYIISKQQGADVDVMDRLMLEINKIDKISLRSARIAAGFTQTEAARRMNISVRTIKRYEQNVGEIPLDVAIKLLRLYRVSFRTVKLGI